MGITNIDILMNDDAGDAALRAQMEREAALILAHRRGRHPYGSMRHDCPLCQERDGR